MPYPRYPISLGFCDQMPLSGNHICYIYTDDEERMRVLAEFFRAGHQSDEKLLYVTDSLEPDELIEVMSKCGCELGHDRQSEVVPSSEIYYPHGSFSTPGMLERIREFYEGAIEQGWRGARGTGEMGWVARDVHGAEKAFDYEAQLTRLLEKYPYTAVCQYDARRFSGDFLMKVLQVHPYVIVRGQLVQNPYFIEPESFASRPSIATSASNDV